MVRFIGSRLRLGFGRFASVYDTARSRESAATPLTGFGSARTTTSTRSSGALSPARNDIAEKQTHSLRSDRWPLLSQNVFLNFAGGSFGQFFDEGHTVRRF